jgi:hypothetical protein
MSSGQPGWGAGALSVHSPSPAYVSDFLATSDGLSLTKAFMRIKSGKLRHRITGSLIWWSILSRMRAEAAKPVAVTEQ